ncbi:MAG: succinyl-diaminopimelate desuccinylase [Acidiferrobacteraceae bacterium]
MTDVVDLATALIALPSETPIDGGCQGVIAEHLQPLGFSINRLHFGGVSNLWARSGTEAPLVVFAGHTDVVPPGPLQAWQSPPFQPQIRHGLLYGRGAADMKSSIAAFLVAVKAFLAKRSSVAGSIGLLITSDEEGAAIDGTAKVVEWLRARGEHIDYCLVGEPSCEQQLGDVIKNGRRGSLNARLTVPGKQGHVAYPHLADNPIHKALPALAALTREHWDDGDEDFPATSFQISNIHSGTGADNVIPGVTDVSFNFRFSPKSDENELRSRVERLLVEHGVSAKPNWVLSGHPFVTRGGALLQALIGSIRETLGVEPRLSTGGGTSDGRFIATLGAEVAEFGPINRSIHQANEHVLVEDLPRLARVYEGVLDRLLS